MSLPWFRLYGETVDDPKLRLLAFEDRWHYVAVLCCKSQGVQDTTIPAMLDRMMAVKLGLAERELGEVRRRLVEMGLIDSTWQPVAWERRQFASDSSRERTRKWRARQSSPTPPPTDTDSEQNRTERDVTSDVTATSRQKSKASRIPDDWKPSDSLTAYAEEQLPNVDVPRLAEEFTDYWRAKAGEKARKVDWDATWRTWVRRSGDRYPMKRQPARAEKQIRIDANGRQISG